MFREQRGPRPPVSATRGVCAYVRCDTAETSAVKKNVATVSGAYEVRRIRSSTPRPHRAALDVADARVHGLLDVVRVVVGQRRVFHRPPEPLLETQICGVFVAQCCRVPRRTAAARPPAAAGSRTSDRRGPPASRWRWCLQPVQTEALLTRPAFRASRWPPRGPGTGLSVQRP